MNINTEFALNHTSHRLINRAVGGPCFAKPRQIQPADDAFSAITGHQPQQRKAWSHERVPHGKDEWLTPPWLIQKLGKFDLDPCSPINPPWSTAARHYSIEDDGLTAPWAGRVWMNPPYSSVGPWMRRLVQHGNGIALIFSRTDTKAFFECVWDAADAVLFLRGRLKFYHVDGTPAADTAGAPSCLVAYGARNVAALQSSGIPGKLIVLRPSPTSMPPVAAPIHREMN